MHNKVTIRQQAGATLVELIISIVVISTAIAGVLGIVNITVLHSADPIVQQQAIAIAESYLEEITALPIIDPDGNNAGEDRATFDNVDDYHNHSDTGVNDQNGNAIADLANYNVDITVDQQNINGVNDMRIITVTVTRPGTSTIGLVAYKAPL